MKLFKLEGKFTKAMYILKGQKDLEYARWQKYSSYERATLDLDLKKRYAEAAEEHKIRYSELCDLIVIFNGLK